MTAQAYIGDRVNEELGIMDDAVRLSKKEVVPVL
jgi:hypothetical protein